MDPLPASNPTPPSSDKKFYLVNGILLSIAILLPLSIFYLRQYDFKNLFYSSSQTYSTIAFNPQLAQAISVGDTLTGKGLPNSKIKIFLTPSSIFDEIKTDNQGNWVYKIPLALKKGNYYLTLQILDERDNLASIKSYKLQIAPKFQFPLTSIGTTYAQDTSRGPEFANWVTQMQALGFYPAEENGEIVLYNRDEYVRKYCRSGCLLNPPRIQEIIDSVKADEGLISDLLVEAYDNNYSPFEALLPYFPSLTDTPQYQSFVKRGNIYVRSPLLPPLQTQIDPDTLKELIQRVATKRGFTEKDPIQILINTTDPIFGTRTLINVLTLPPYKVSDDDRVIALLSLSVVYGTSEKVVLGGMRIGSDIAINLPKAIKDMRIIRGAIKSGEAVPLKSLKPQAETWMTGENLAIRPGEVIKNPLSKVYPAEAREYWFRLAEFTAQDAILSGAPANTRPIMEKVWNYVEYLGNKGLIKGFHQRLKKEEVFETVENRWVVYVRDDAWQQTIGLPEASGLAEGRAVFLRWSAQDGYTLTHEFGHVVGYRYQDTSKVAGKYFDFSFGTTSYDEIMRVLYEMGTDDMASLLSGQASAYKKGYPQLSESVSDLINYLTTYSNGRFTWEDLHAFAITADDGAILQKLFGVEDPQKMVDLMSGKIDFVKLDQIYKANIRTKSLISIATTPVVHDISANLRGFIALQTNSGNQTAPVMITSPVYQVNAGFLTDNFKEQIHFNGDVIINQVSGENVPGGQLDVSTLVSENNRAADSSEFATTWSIEPDEGPQTQLFIRNALAQEEKEKLLQSLNEVQAIDGGDQCPTSCKLHLPTDLKPGKYRLKAYLSHQGSDAILDEDSYEIEIKPPVVKSVKVNDWEIFNYNRDQGVDIRVADTAEEPRTLISPVVATYSDNKTKFFTLKFNYIPPAKPSPTPTVQPTPIEQPSTDTNQSNNPPSQQSNQPSSCIQDTFVGCGQGCGIDRYACSDGSNVKETYNPNGDCAKSIYNSACTDQPNPPSAPPSCKDAYPQCGGTAGLESYDPTDTVWVTPICDTGGNIVDYKHDNLGNRGECP